MRGARLIHSLVQGQEARAQKDERRGWWKWGGESQGKGPELPSLRVNGVGVWARSCSISVV